MSKLYYQIFPVVSIVLGECLSIYAEMLAAKYHDIMGSSSFINVFIKAFVVITFGGAFLTVGYMLGYKGFRNIWVVAALSTTAILIVEPFIAYSLFQTMPTNGALVGLILGIIGFIVAFI